MRFKGKTVLVTGASRGIGEAIACQAAAEGADVVLTARSETALADVAAKIQAAGGVAHIAPADAADPAAIEAVVAAADKRFGRLDVLINNAGTIDPIARVASAEAEAWTHAMAVNLIGPALFIRAALPHLHAGHGCIVNMSSGAAHRPLEGWSAYCASKAALWMLTQLLHLEEGYGVDVYAVSPGTVDTEMQVAIRASGVNPVSKLPRSSLAPPSLPAAGCLWLAATRPEDLKGQDVNIRTAEFLERAGIES